MEILNNIIKRKSQTGYWNDRFREKGKIWGEQPCGAAIQAEMIFKNHCISKLLIPGCGYGRNTLFFAKKDFQVTGFDISSIAIEMANEEAKKEELSIRYFVDDILNFPLMGEKFEGIFSFNTLHLFSEIDREKISAWLTDSLTKKGVLILTSMSTNDGDFGKGKEVAPNTFESKKGRPVFYFDKDSILDLFQRRLEIKRLEEIYEQENHGGKFHIHWMWFIVGQK